MELFPGLPRELGRQCLLRVPYTSHHNLTAVCGRWETVVKSPQFYQDRKNHGTSQHCICCICLIEIREYPANYTDNDLQILVTVYDPLQGTWETLPRLPVFPVRHLGFPLFCDCVSVNQKLILIGRWKPSDLNALEALNTVFIYGFLSVKWSRGADMPLVRISGACSVSPEGLVYVAGGHDDEVNALRGAAVYNVAEDEWKILPDMSQERDECYGAFIHGKFIVISGHSTHAPDRFKRSAEIYDPETGAWSMLENMWTVGDGKGPRSCVVAASSSGSLYSFQKKLGVIQYDWKKNVWRAVGSLPETLPVISSCVEWRDRIFVSGYAKTSGGYDQVFYMFEPPPFKSAAGTQAETCGKWAAIERPESSNVDYVQGIGSTVVCEI